MKKNYLNETLQRRQFLGTIATGVAALGLTTLAPLHLNAENLSLSENESSLPDEESDEEEESVPEANIQIRAQHNGYHSESKKLL